MPLPDRSQKTKQIIHCIPSLVTLPANFVDTFIVHYYFCFSAVTLFSNTGLRIYGFFSTKPIFTGRAPFSLFLSVTTNHLQLCFFSYCHRGSSDALYFFSKPLLMEILYFKCFFDFCLFRFCCVIVSFVLLTCDFDFCNQYEWFSTWSSIYSKFGDNNGSAKLTKPAC